VKILFNLLKSKDPHMKKQSVKILPIITGFQFVVDEIVSKHHPNSLICKFKIGLIFQSNFY